MDYFYCTCFILFTLTTIKIQVFVTIYTALHKFVNNLKLHLKNEEIDVFECDFQNGYFHEEGFCLVFNLNVCRQRALRRQTFRRIFQKTTVICMQANVSEVYHRSKLLVPCVHFHHNRHFASEGPTLQHIRMAQEIYWRVALFNCYEEHGLLRYIRDLT